MSKKTIIVDMDGVICTEEKTFSRSLASPMPLALTSLELIRSEGYSIIIYTARSWSEYEMTEEWLNRHKIPYDRLICGKPIGDIWVDDRAIAHTDWKETLKEIRNK
jgi:uncharacterized HAD superfamily protein